MVHRGDRTTALDRLRAAADLRRLSEAVDAEQVLFSLILFGLIYLLLFVLFIFLLDRKIRQGPVVEAAAETSAKRYVPADHKEN